jgi:hypothetical protein
MKFTFRADTVFLFYKTIRRRKLYILWSINIANNFETQTELVLTPASKVHVAAVLFLLTAEN